MTLVGKSSASLVASAHTTLAGQGVPSHCTFYSLITTECGEIPLSTRIPLMPPQQEEGWMCFVTTLQR